MDVLISIVAPVYNVASYLPTFIDSIIGQTYPNWELLLIDDGSTDNSGTICDEYAKRDNRIRVFHKANGGVCSARNVGLREMKGEWALMPDPDDELPENALESFGAQISDEIDLISSSYVWYKNGILSIPAKPSSDLILDRDDYISLMGIIPQPRNLDRRVANKLFRVSIIKNNSIYFSEDIYLREDILYNYQYISKCNGRIRCVPNNTYIYYMRSSGAATSLRDRYTPRSKGLFIAMTRCYDLLEQMGAPIESKDRMKLEILSSYRAITSLKGGMCVRDSFMCIAKLLHYYSFKDLFVLGIKKIEKRLFR